jgi:hypothetical protein
MFQDIFTFAEEPPDILQQFRSATEGRKATRRGSGENIRSAPQLSEGE